MTTTFTIDKLTKLLSSAIVETQAARPLDIKEYLYREQILTMRRDKYLDILRVNYWAQLSKYAPSAMRQGSLWDVVICLRREESTTAARDLGQLANYLIRLGSIFSCLRHIERRLSMDITYREIIYEQLCNNTVQ